MAPSAQIAVAELIDLFGVQLAEPVNCWCDQESSSLTVFLSAVCFRLLQSDNR